MLFEAYLCTQEQDMRAAMEGIVAWSISEHPDMAQQMDMLCMLIEKLPAWKHPLLHSDMGWQY
jgi:hypothetical protein